MLNLHEYAKRPYRASESDIVSPLIYPVNY